MNTLLAIKTMPYLFAIEGGAEILKKSAAKTDELTKGWDDMWQQVVVNPPTNGTYHMVALVASWVATFLAVAWLFNRAPQIFKGQPLLPAFSFLIVPVLISVGISNHAVNMAKLSYGINRVLLYSNNLAMSIQVVTTSFNDAVANMNLTSEAKDIFQREMQRCADLKPNNPVVPSSQTPASSQPGQPQPTGQNSFDTDPQTQCYRKLLAKIDKMQADFQRERCSGFKRVTVCSGAADFFRHGRQGLEEGIDKLQEDFNRDPNSINIYTDPTRYAFEGVARRLEGYIAAGTALDTFKSILYSIQWVYMNLLVGGMFLSGLSGPIALAMSLGPITPRPIWQWLIYFCGFGLAMFYYNALIGMTAAIIVSSKNQSMTELQYALMLGVFAPAASGYLAHNQVQNAVRGIGQNAAMAAGIGASVASTVGVALIRVLAMVK